MKNKYLIGVTHFYVVHMSRELSVVYEYMGYEFVSHMYNILSHFL